MNKQYENWDLNGCTKCSTECHFRCCDQSKITDNDFGPENALLLYPGEYEASDLPKDHIVLSCTEYFNGKLGYCSKETFDQSTCSADKNMKPLDCRSYPFFPAITNGELELRIDMTRCPLSRDLSLLKEHYNRVLNAWSERIAKDEKIKEWISNIELQGYQIVPSTLFHD